LRELDTFGYGSIYVNEISANKNQNTGLKNYQYPANGLKYDKSAMYSLVVFMNQTSVHATGMWAAYAQEIILRQFLSEKSGTKKVQLKIVEDPLPISDNS